MGAYTTGKRLADLTVADSMSRSVTICHRDDDVAVAATRMAAHSVRRLPVVDEHGRLEGIVSLADLARVGERDTAVGRAASRVLGVVSHPRLVAEPERAGATGVEDGRARLEPTPANADRGAVLLRSQTEREC